jgi:hypothetical protein
LALVGRLPKLLNTVINTTAMMTQRSIFLAISFNAFDLSGRVKKGDGLVD